MIQLNKIGYILQPLKCVRFDFSNEFLIGHASAVSVFIALFSKIKNKKLKYPSGPIRIILNQYLGHKLSCLKYEPEGYSSTRKF